MEIQSVITLSASVYQVNYSTGLVAFVPVDPQNADYMRVEAWVSAGGSVSVTSPEQQ